MLPFVSGVALLVQIYSLGYMSRETGPSLGRYYAFHSLFAFSMLGFVLSHNTLQAYGFWELVGLSSYLLIGFWYRKPEAARAAVKAFWTTRLGDAGFAVGIVLLWGAQGSFVFEELFREAAAGRLGGPILVAGVAGLFLGAMGKSAQFPLHVWLPDAMEGPTPVSALIHAATMVAAGVFLVIRIGPLLAATPEIASWVLGIGAITAVLAAGLALIERDIKRVLAYSTVSQLGLMMVAAGVGASKASLVHLVFHGFFKALLFLAAGSLIHALATNDLFRMGRLAGPMPWTAGCFLAGAAGLAGIFPTSGFFSKEDILAAVWEAGHPIVFSLLVLTTCLTACYIFRAFLLAFWGHPRAGVRPHESPAVMVAPMLVLAGLVVGGGALRGGIEALFERSISFAPETGSRAAGEGLLVFVAAAASLVGAGLAWGGYQAGWFSPGAVGAKFRPLLVLLERRYFLDDLFLSAYRAGYLGSARLLGWTDRYLVDGAVNFVTWATAEAARLARRVQTGRVQDALYAFAFGIVLLLVLVSFR